MAQSGNTTAKTKKKSFEMPHIYVIIFVIIAVFAVLTYIVPAGQYQRIPGPDGREMIDPASYTRVEQTPVSVFDVFKSIPTGLREANDIIFAILVIGGLFEVLKKTGVIEVGVTLLARTFSNRPALIIPVLMYMFATIAAFIDTPELAIVYVPIIIPVMLKLGYDTVTATAVALGGTITGYIGAMTNPFTVGIAQEIAGLPRFSGIGYRFIVFLIITAIAAVYIVTYARKVKKNPTLSSTYEDDLIKRQKLAEEEGEQFVATTRQKVATAVTVLMFIGMMLCVLIYRWDMIQIGGYFIIMALVPSIIVGLRPSVICETFDDGFRGILAGAMICGVVRGVVVIMTQGNIIDTIIYGLATVLQNMPGNINVIGMLIIQFFINFFIPSGSGQALITIPIMAPLADLVGVTRQCAILAYQFGDGLSNIIFPTSGYFMATLSVAGVKWNKWAKFILPLMGMWLVAAAILLVVANTIGWS